MSARSTGPASARSSRSVGAPRAVGTRPPRSAACHPADGCITCSDEGVPMRVIETLPVDGLAICAAADGSRAEVMTDLVGPVSAGDRLLVHAGTALLALDPAGSGTAGRPGVPEDGPADEEAP